MLHPAEELLNLDADIRPIDQSMTHDPEQIRGTANQLFSPALGVLCAGGLSATLKGSQCVAGHKGWSGLIRILHSPTQVVPVEDCCMASSWAGFNLSSPCLPLSTITAPHTVHLCLLYSIIHVHTCLSAWVLVSWKTTSWIMFLVLFLLFRPTK